MSSADEIYKAHSKTVYRYLLSLTHDENLSEDLTQETFYQAIKSLNKFDGNCKITTWLCSIAKNCLKSYNKKHPLSGALDESIPSPQLPESEVLVRSETINIIKKLHMFGDDTREVMYLRLFGSLSFREIGEILGRTENWSRVTFYRGKERLKKELEKDEQ